MKPNRKVPGVNVDLMEPAGEGFEPLGYTKPALSKKYIHDCEKCDYLGSIEIDSQHYDFYVCYICHTCRSDEGYSTYIARYGSDGPDYVSFPNSVLKSIKPHDEIESVLKIECVIREGEFRSHNYRFALVQQEESLNTITVLVSPLIEERQTLYIQDALERVKALFIYEAITPSTLYSMIHGIETLVRQQIRMRR